jgi:hypothetical protein
MRVYLRKLVYLAAASSLGAIGWLSLEPTYACPSTQTVITYYSDVAKTDAVGEGATDCSTGAFQMCWGYQTSNTTTDHWDCGACGTGC